MAPSASDFEIVSLPGQQDPNAHPVAQQAAQAASVAPGLPPGQQPAQVPQPSLQGTPQFSPSDFEIVNQPTQQEPQSNTLAALSRGFGEGGSFGFASEIGGGLEAVMGALQGLATGKNAYGDEGRLASLENFAQNYARSRDTLDQQRQGLAVSDPIASTVGELGGFVTGGLLSAPALASAGATGAIAQGAIQGGAAGLGKSNKSSIQEAATDTAIGAGVGAAVAGVVQKLFGGATSAIARGKDGGLKIQYGTTPAEAFELGSQQAAALADPNAQAAIKAELDATALQGLPAAIKQNFQRVGQQWDQEIAKWGDKSVKATGILDDMLAAASKIAPEGDEVAVSAQKALKERITSIAGQLAKSSPTGSLDDVPLSSLAKVQKEFGDLVRGQKAYARSPQVDGVAKLALGKMIKGFNAADEVASGGVLSDLNKAFTRLYDMKDVASGINGNTIKSWANPLSAQSDKFTSLVTPLTKDAKITPLLADSYNFIMNNLAKSIKKAQVADAVLKASKSDASLLSLKGLNALKDSVAPVVANKLGANPIAGPILSTANKVAPTLAGAGAVSLKDISNNQ